MNVFQYAAQVFGSSSFILDGMEDDLTSMPVDSECGNECKIAIDSAICLIHSIRKAHGNKSEAEAEIIYRTIYACSVFICG